MAKPMATPAIGHAHSGAGRGRSGPDRTPATTVTPVTAHDTKAQDHAVSTPVSVIAAVEVTESGANHPKVLWKGAVRPPTMNPVAEGQAPDGGHAVGTRWADPVPPRGRSPLAVAAARVGASFLMLPVGWQVVIVGLTLVLGVLVAALP